MEAYLQGKCELFFQEESFQCKSNDWSLWSFGFGAICFLFHVYAYY